MAKSNQKPARSIDGMTSPSGSHEDPLGLKQELGKKAQKTRKPKTPKVGKFVSILLALALIAAAAWFFVLKSDTELTNADVIENVSSLVGDLPNEQPTVATIEDAEAITKQDGFYEGAKTGDKVLVYPQSKRAIIYSVADNKIVKDGTVSVSQ